ncbi:MAG: FAD-dependent oxidoreductase [Armatimonadetes bacterium]|nr:FAD-dependent oxidoreductase [Armatimonadota bacterium]
MPQSTREIETDVAVIGGGTGGCAAALRAARLGCRVVMTEETEWIGGQLTAQGVSALDEHRFIETFGGTASYYELREGIRAHYRSRYGLTPGAAANPLLNPGNGWVSRLCFEPRAGLAVLETMLQPGVDAGRIHILRRTAPVAAETAGDRVEAITVRALDGETTRIRAGCFLDATELGDLLPLAGAEWVTGSESRAETGEPHAPDDANEEWAQSFTFSFAVELRPGEEHTIPEPEGYEHFRETQPYTFAVEYAPPVGSVAYRMFEKAPGTYGPFWSYRRLIDRRNFDDPAFPNDIAMINWPGNDYAGGSPITAGPERRAELFRQARLLSLGLLYWLQTEAPRDDGGFGYPELRLRRDVMGTPDGLSHYPYIRESRRIRALKTIREPEIAADSQPGARAAFFPDSVGIGLYGVDIHACAANQPQVMLGTRPFQIPLGALVPLRVRNLLPAAKNIGTTHITNGAYRLHPVEWNIGEAAGALAAFCLSTGALPREVARDEPLLRRFQRTLLQCGVPLYWYEDVPLSHPAFAAAQWLAITGVWPGREEHLRFEPDAPIDPEGLARETGMSLETAVSAFGGAGALPRGECAARLADRV